MSVCPQVYLVWFVCLLIYQIISDTYKIICDSLYLSWFIQFFWQFDLSRKDNRLRRFGLRPNNTIIPTKKLLLAKGRKSYGRAAAASRTVFVMNNNTAFYSFFIYGTFIRCAPFFATSPFVSGNPKNNLFSF